MVRKVPHKHMLLCYCCWESASSTLYHLSFTTGATGMAERDVFLSVECMDDSMLDDDPGTERLLLRCLVTMMPFHVRLLQSSRSRLSRRARNLYSAQVLSGKSIQQRPKKRSTLDYHVLYYPSSISVMAGASSEQAKTQTSKQSARKLHLLNGVTRFPSLGGHYIAGRQRCFESLDIFRLQAVGSDIQIFKALKAAQGIKNLRHIG